MRWKGRRGSENVEDRRSAKGPVIAGGGLLGFIIVVGIMLLGGDPKPVMQQMNRNAPGAQGAVANSPEDEERAAMVSVVLADTEDVWKQVFETQVGARYVEPKLVMFRDKVQSACGFQSAATGPFYCPLDSQVYIDLGFFDEMKQKLGAPGDFAQAYVVAHEVGHHVQNLLGTSDEVNRLRARASKEQGNELSVRLELQADFYAGVWAHHAQQNWQILEEGDIEEALQAATAIGDDRLQKQARGFVVPESFTHGTSQQRVRWFIKGLKSGDLSEGNTFEIPYNQL